MFLSVFNFFKNDVDPSSFHTTGPMLAARLLSQSPTLSSISRIIPSRVDCETYTIINVEGLS
ncbi:MAG: hypothetical protein K8S26_21715 [Agrobacterium sp.]|nr:hypothetical protein [Agrobacterium sp.]